MATVTRAGADQAFGTPVTQVRQGAVAPLKATATRPAPDAAQQTEAAGPNLYEQVLAELFAGESYLSRKDRP